jgi:hypothetical protein
MTRPQPEKPLRYFVQQSFDGGNRWTSFDGYRTARYAQAVSHAQRWVVDAMRDGHFYDHRVRITDQEQRAVVMEIYIKNSHPAEADYDDLGNELE